MCSLQIHSHFSASRYVEFANGPLSVPNAVGIIIAHGHPGTALSRLTDVWMTRDGGYNWYKVWYKEAIACFNEHLMSNAIFRRTPIMQYAAKPFFQSIYQKKKPNRV